MSKGLGIDDLLNSLKRPTTSSEKFLANTKDTWERIGNGDAFDELGLSGQELDDFINEWIKDNPYSNI